MQLSVEAYMNERQHITLELMGNVSQSASSEPTSFPDAADIVENIHNGTIAVHSDRAAVTKKQIQIQINTSDATQSTREPWHKVLLGRVNARRR